MRAQGIVWGYYSLFNISRLPDAAYRGFFKAVFHVRVPMVLVANVPAKVLINKLRSPGELVLAGRHDRRLSLILGNRLAFLPEALHQRQFLMANTLSIGFSIFSIGTIISP